MQIDWLTVAAQIVNFLVLVWLLKRFLYGPIIGAMERRERRIRDRVREAVERQAEAEAEAERFRQEQAEIERRREQIMAEAREAAEAERRALERAARAQVEEHKNDWLAQIEAQRDEFLRELSRHASDQFFRLARKSMADLADAELEERIALHFAGQLEALGPEVRKRLAEACAASSGRVVVRSRLELPPGARRRLAQAVHETISGEAELAYERNDDVLCGIELRTGSQTLDWSLRSYLDGFEAAVGGQVASVLAPVDSQAAS